MKRGLGKGLGALLEDAKDQENGVLNIKINKIEPNNDQPRKNFDDDKLSQLAESIRQHGVVQPIIVRKEGDIFRIIAGERRWRAARIAGLENVPVILKDISNKEVMEIALIENIQREDLNPIEEADAFQKLMHDHGITQEQLSKIIGRSRPSIANSVRLLGLSYEIKNMVASSQLSSGHARALIVVVDKDLQIKLARMIIEKGISVRETESLIKKAIEGKEETITKKMKNEYVIDIEDRLKNIFGTKVQILANKKKGKILIEYYSNEELERIIEMVNQIPEKNDVP